jgi:hypothetical protein
MHGINMSIEWNIIQVSETNPEIQSNKTMAWKSINIAAGQCEFCDQKQGDLKCLNFAMKYDVGDD